MLLDGESVAEAGANSCLLEAKEFDPSNDMDLNTLFEEGLSLKATPMVEL
tara:strand:+ start:1886 stop:2035 length:150 start_codon:yes stop_codon:yes gene_type:complete